MFLFCYGMDFMGYIVEKTSSRNILNSSLVKDFSRRSRAANSAVHGQNWPNVELIRYFMVVLVICKTDEHSIKNEGARVFTTL